MFLVELIVSLFLDQIFKQVRRNATVNVFLFNNEMLFDWSKSCRFLASNNATCFTNLRLPCKLNTS